MIAAAIPGHYQFSRDLGVSPVSRHFLYSFSFFGHGLETGKITKSLEYRECLETGTFGLMLDQVPSELSTASYFCSFLHLVTLSFLSVKIVAVGTLH